MEIVDVILQFVGKLKVGLAEIKLSKKEHVIS